MNSGTGIVVLSVMIVFSLVVVSFANRIENRSRLMRQKASQITRRIESLEELCSSIEPLLESVLIPRLVNEEVIDLIRSLEQLDPSVPSLEVKRLNATEVAESLASGQRTQPLYRAQSSDAAIARSKHYLIEAARVARRHHAVGRLESAELESYLKELFWAHLMVDVISHITQGHKAVNRDEPEVAYGFYRRAQTLLMGATTADTRRHRFIKEISEILAGQRMAISTELMPEAEFNPTDKPDFENVQSELDELNRSAGVGYKGS